ncbi:MAG: NAD(P)-binding protein [Gammaproteobacteria bacterium]
MSRKINRRPACLRTGAQTGTQTTTRRAFLQGMAVPLGATLSSAGWLGAGAAPAASGSAHAYPPGLTGMRGAHPGSFEVAHALAREGRRWSRPTRRTDDVYDLVVVGAGISGLAAAWLFRQQVGGDCRILILDNHDDFGGHAKRNEMVIDGRTLIGYGGGQSLEAPRSYSRVARQLIESVGVDVARFHDYFDSTFQSRFGLDHGVLFERARFGVDRLVPDAVTAADAASLQQRLADYPVSTAVRAALWRLYAGQLNDTPAVRAALTTPEQTRFETFVSLATDMPEDGFRVLRDITNTFWGFGADALSLAEMLDYPALGPGLSQGIAALQARGSTAPATAPATAPGRAAIDASGEGSGPVELYPEEPYIFHFPDGNAGLARLLVRSLIPDAVPGVGAAQRRMADIVRSPLRYDRLDDVAHTTRIRLSATVVSVTPRGDDVDVVYVRGDAAQRVVARHVILACWNHMIPHLCPELPAAQRAALEYPEKIPLAVINVGLRQWRPIADSGLSEVYAPGGFLSRLGLDFPVSMGGYRFSADPGEPAILDCWHAPAARDPALPPRERLRLGRHAMLALEFADYEREVRAQLSAAWGAHGFDPDRDIAAITVNRWPHGYAWEYTDLWDPPAASRGAGPHVIGRQQLGRISIANADSEAFAYVDGAIDAAYRAVHEQTAR